MLFRQTLLYLPAQLFGPLIQFVAAIVWTHQLDATAYGIVTYLIAAQELTAALALGGWSSYVLRHRDELGEHYGRELRQRDLFFVSAGAVIQILIAVPLLASIHVPITPLLVGFTALFLITRTALGHYADICRAEAAIGTFTIGQLASPVVGCALSFWAIATFGSDPGTVLAALSFAQALGLIIVMRRLGVSGKPILPDRALLRKAFLYSGPLIAASVAMWIGGNGIRVTVEHMSGPIALGLLSVGWGLGQRIAAVVAMLVTAAAFPLAVKHLKSGDHAGAMRQVAVNNLLILGMLAPMATGAVIVAPNLVNLVIAEPYRAITTIIFPIAALAGALRNLSIHGACQTFLLASRTDLTLKVDIADAVLTMTGCTIGLYVGGLIGATLGCLIAAAIWVLITFTFAVRLGLPLMLAKAARILIAALVMGAALVLVPFPAGITGLVETVAFGGLVYATMLVASFTEARDLIRTRLGRMTARG